MKKTNYFYDFSKGKFSIESDVLLKNVFLATAINELTVNFQTKQQNKFNRVIINPISQGNNESELILISF